MASGGFAAAQGTPTTGADGERIVVGLVQIDPKNPFHLGEVEGAQEAARRYGFELRVTSGEGDVNKQVQAVENLINEGVDAIAVNFIDINAFGPTLQKAQEARIPVVCLHSVAEGCATMLGFDEKHNGRIAGEHAVELLTEKYGEPRGKVANLQGLLGQGLNEDRTGGFTDVMAEYPNIEVVAKEPTNWDAAKAAAVTENWLTRFPDLDLIYGNSDSLTLPAANVIERAGKADDILLVSVLRDRAWLERRQGRHARQHDPACAAILRLLGRRGCRSVSRWVRMSAMRSSSRACSSHRRTSTRSSSSRRIRSPRSRSSSSSNP